MISRWSQTIWGARARSFLQQELGARFRSLGDTEAAEATLPAIPPQPRPAIVTLGYLETLQKLVLLLIVSVCHPRVERRAWADEWGRFQPFVEGNWFRLDGQISGRCRRNRGHMLERR